MPQLSEPVVRVHQSFLAAMAELRAEGRGAPDDETQIGAELRQYGGSWASRDVFAAYVAALKAEALEDTPRPVNYVPCTNWWLVDGDEYLGRIALRHRLTETLLEAGGHIGYDVRPSARRRGHATFMLRQVLAEAHARGIDEVLITCEVDNVGSRRVIEANGGVLEDQRGNKLRFWVRQ